MEWKHRDIRLGLDQLDPLETSLVEWKQILLEEVRGTAENLGNFLSGMETCALAAFSKSLRFPWKLP